MDEENKGLIVLHNVLEPKPVTELEDKVRDLKRELTDALNDVRRWKMAVQRAVTQMQLRNIIDIAAHIDDVDNPGDYGTPRTDDHYLHPVVGLRRCPCGQPGCDRFWLTGIGQFNQGSGFTEQEGRDIVEVMKTLPKYQLKMKNMNPTKRRDL
jgi:hypothetical protein